MRSRFWKTTTRLFCGGLALVSAHAFLIACGALPPDRADGASTDPSFESWWRDGRAEMNGYTFRVNRYGEERKGEAVMIFVTEPFSLSMRVKVDDPSAKPDDTVDVLKLNFVRDFQTGIYDYNTMTSLFSKSSDFSPLKISFSSAEWCGHVYDELLFGNAKIDERFFSYFEGESSERELARPEGGITEEELYILLRGLRGAYLEPGRSRTVPFLPEAFYRRLVHQPAEWTKAVISRSSAGEKVTVAAGDFRVDRFKVQVESGRVGEFRVESEYPHRIITWTWTDAGESPQKRLGGGSFSGELMGSDRLAYWKLHGEADAAALSKMGLRSR